MDAHGWTKERNAEIHIECFLCKRNAKGMEGIEGEGMMNDVDVTFLEAVFLSQPFRRRNRVARWQTSRAWT